MRDKTARYILIMATMLFMLTGCKKEVLPEGSKEIKTQDSGNAAKGFVEPENRDEEDSAERKGEAVLAENAIRFSLTSSFYSADSELQILISKPGKIYYTLDGTDPDEGQLLYQEAIKLNAGEETDAICVKAKAFFEDGSRSEILVHTYFVGEFVNDRFDTLVFSVTSDPYNLYDYEYGILVEGKLRDDYVKENPWKKIDPPAPANYNLRGRESEREVFVEIFEPDGTRIAAQAAGIRTYGGWSRANLQKSIKIFTRKEYDPENNKLRYEFFPRKITTEGKRSDAFNRLVLRNCGNDNGFAFIRDELFQTLAGQAGYMDYEAVRPAVLFINGEYRGAFWIHEVYGDDYFDENYGNFDGEFQILEGGETYKEVDEDGENEQVAAEYEAWYTAYAARDLTDETAYQELCRLMDVENYLSYYALQIYIGNEDWPHNNYKVYRYYAKEGEDYREAPFDGKWRYLLHDLDFSFGIYGTGALVDNISKYVGSNGEPRKECPLFGQLMKREDCKEIFIKKSMDLINGAFSPDNLNNILEEMHNSRLKEQMNMYDKNLLSDWVRFDQLEGRLEEIRIYGEQRAGHIPGTYQRHFKLGELYQLSVQPAEGCGVKINSVVTKEYFIGHYFTDYDTVIIPDLPEGKQFDYWQVNGKKYEEEELIITPSMLRELKAEVICVIK